MGPGPVASESSRSATIEASRSRIGHHATGLRGGTQGYADAASKNGRSKKKCEVNPSSVSKTLALNNALMAS
jgi:hypothetical protein